MESPISPTAYAAYARKSSEQEDRQVASIESQYRALVELAERTQIPIKLKYEESASAKRPGRSVFTELVAAIEAGTVDALLVCQRRGEIASLEWEWLEDDTVTFPATITKNRKPHTIPLCEQVQAIVSELPRVNGYLFPAMRSHVSVEPYTLHDLRRTFSSTLAVLGVPMYVTEKLLDHTSVSFSGVSAVYKPTQLSL